MGKSPVPADFKIHVDPSCLTDSTDLEVQKIPDTSTDTMSKHAGSEDPTQTSTAATVEDKEHRQSLDPSELLDERIQAQIREAAQRVVENIERDRYEDHTESILSSNTDEDYSREATELTYDGTEDSYTTDNEADMGMGEGESDLNSHIDEALSAWEPDHEPSEDDHEDSSSQHDGDVDDVFSEESGRSQRSSINSIHELGSSDERYQKVLASPAVGGEAAGSDVDERVSRISSVASYTQEDATTRTPTKVKHRPPFRTPSSVRAMQMSSPTPSIFSSPRSTKRHLPTVSRIGTPTSQFSPSKRTPTRFKARKEEPLVLLHVTVMPLSWPYAHAMATREVPESLQHIKESWSLLQDKLGDTVFERGVLLAHPQDSYEVLEERLLDALDLPVRPRARILKCGHYMGPSDLETPSSDEDSNTRESYFRHDQGTDRKWCDICRKDVKLEDTGETCGKRRFNVKVYASNGLMKSGAWAAVWREMERVDVEIEPWIEVANRGDLEEFAAPKPSLEAVAEEADDGFVDDDEIEGTTVVKAVELVEDQNELEEHRQSAAERELRRKFEEDEFRHRMMEEEKLRRLLEEEEALQQKLADEESQRKIIEEDHIYSRASSPPPLQRQEDHSRTHSRQQSHAHQTVNPDSLPELLLAAFKVLMRDKKNIAIAILSFVVVLLAIRPSQTSIAEVDRPKIVVSEPVPEVIASISMEKFNYVTVTATTTVEAPAQTIIKVEQISSEEAPLAEVQVTPEEMPVVEFEDSEKVPSEQQSGDESLHTEAEIPSVEEEAGKEQATLEGPEELVEDEAANPLDVLTATLEQPEIPVKELDAALDPSDVDPVKEGDADISTV